MAATSTAISTMVLALEARNNTAAAFSELRGQLREQVEAAQQAARQTAEAARDAQDQQIRDIRQRTAQEQLELRQKTAFEAQQIQQAAAGQSAADRRAAAQRVLMLRQDAEQAALIKRQEAEHAIAAIRSTTEAQRRGSREQLEAVESAARREAEAMRTSQREQAEAARQAAAQERAAAREGEGRRGILGIGLPGMPGVGLLGSLGQMAWWNVGYGAINAATQAVGGFLTGLVTTNSQLEELRQTFTALYGSAAKGQQAVAWLDDFAQKVPATREEVMQAGLTIASLGDNVAPVMKALANVAAVEGVELPRAAQAFGDAQMGRWEMMQMDLHITKAELQKFGLEVDKTGHIMHNSFVPAFERLAASPQFVHGAALQMDAFSGKMSNVADALTRLQEIAGHGIFTVLKGSLDALVNTKNTGLLQTDNAKRWAAAIGDALGHILQAAMHLASWLWTHLGPAVLGVINALVVAWQAAAPLVSGAIRALEGIMAGIGTFLQTSVLPVVQNAIGQIVNWWNDHGKNLGHVWDDLQTGAKTFWTWLGGTAHNVMLEVMGYWTIGWGILSGIVGVGIDLISGDWKKAKTDLVNIWKAIQVGVLEIMNGLVDQLIHVFHLLAGPIATALNAIFVPAFKAVVDVGVELFTFLVLKIEQAFQGMVGNIGTAVVKLAEKFGPIMSVLPGGHAVAAALYAAAAVSPTGKLTDKEIAARVQAAGQGAAAAAGRFIGPHPIPTLSFKETDVTAKIDAWFKDTEDKIDAHLTKGATDTGKKWLDSFFDAIHKHGLSKKQALPKWLTDLLGGPGGKPPAPGAPPGAGGIFDLRSLSEDQQKAVQEAQTRFQLHLERGNITMGQGLQDITAILAAERAAGASRDQLALTALQDTKTLMEQLVSQAQKQFDFDSSVAHPSRQKLQQDELALLKIYAQTPGIAPIDLAKLKQDLDARIAQSTGGGPRQTVADATDRFKTDLLTLGRSTADHARLVEDVNRIKQAEIAAHVSGAKVALDFAANMKKVNEHMKGIAPRVAPYRQAGFDLAAGASYGTTTVTMGPLRDQLVAHLREQLRKADETITALREQIAYLVKIETNTRGTHQETQRTANHVTKPVPRGGAHSHLQRTGVPGHLLVS